MVSTTVRSALSDRIGVIESRYPQASHTIERGALTSASFYFRLHGHDIGGNGKRVAVALLRPGHRLQIEDQIAHIQTAHRNLPDGMRGIEGHGQRLDLQRRVRRRPGKEASAF